MWTAPTLRSIEPVVDPHMPPASLPPLRRFMPLLMAVVVGVVAWLLHRELSSYDYEDIRQALAEIPPARITLAVALTALSYWTLTGYDTLALMHLDHELPYRRTAFASFVGYAFSHNIGLSALGGAAPRYRMYSAWGLSTLQIAALVAFTSATLWVGSLVIAGSTLVLAPVRTADTLRMSLAWARPIGAALLAVVGGYLAATVVRRQPLSLFGWKVALPTPGIAACQVVMSSVDWALAALVPYVLLPPQAGVTVWHFVGIFVIAQTLGLASNLPGGLGVFEAVVLVGLGDTVPGATVVGALVAYRAIYYLLPLVIAGTVLGTHELLRRRAELLRLRAFAGRWLPELTPRVLALTTFLGGAVLLFSGATPGVHGRLTALRDVLPLPVLEMSHFLGSLAGLGLLLLASGLQRRLDAAYVLSSILLAAGAVFSLLKGFDWEEALILLTMLAALLPCRHYFYRRASIVGERFSIGWTIAVLVIVGASIWIGFFVHRHHEYAAEQWWEFTLHGDAPRFLRATVGVVAGGIVFSLLHLLRPTQVRGEAPDAAALALVNDLVAQSPRASAHLALLGDKDFLFAEARDAFVMYAPSGRSLVAMGDPVGPRDAWPDLVWRFRELCDRAGSWPVFYEASTAALPLHLDVGLTALKFGEEACVPLGRFSLDGGAHKSQRYVLRRLERDGAAFEVHPPGDVPALLPALRDISDVWLREKRTREKSFSLGCFDDAFLARSPVAIVRVQGRIVAFANVWCSGGSEEVSPDLMRHGSDAPDGIMEYLFLQLALWAKAEGYRWLNLGMAPLAGLESRPLAPLWHRLGSFAYLYGEPFYNFQGLRRFKEKFDPEWRPKYLVSPGGLVVPRVLANVAALVSGGLRGVVAR